MVDADEDMDMINDSLSLFLVRYRAYSYRSCTPHLPVECSPPFLSVMRAC